ncbi:rod shape-determining protein MreD [Natribacillus halophilus]|uniref:Rod shape-determining protein MreD n=1 Tax=Natribacillus halophilus TaxID=549003 RepID=A0A1G8LRV4_9BACI|nr:rod shape-determining protein MreD [Natribacillus halophilus]SDI58217.1 rod shape-determining protein MreD [Natribacillus halophilus]
MRYLLPVLIAFVFLFEGTWFQVLFPATGEIVWVPRFAFVMVVFVSIYKGAVPGLIYGLILGFFQDVVYSSLLGIYMFSFAFLGYSGGISYETVKNRPLLVILIVILVVSALEYLTYGIYHWIDYTSIPFTEFVTQRWVPSMILNGAFAILIFTPMRKLFNRLQQEERLKQV